MPRRRWSMGPISIVLLIFIVVIGARLGITYATRQSYTITVNDTEIKRGRVGKNPNDKYLVFATTSDGEDKVFENTDSLLNFKWDSSDIQAKLKQGHKYNIEVYGFRIPFLSSYQNIIDVKEIPNIK